MKILSTTPNDGEEPQRVRFTPEGIDALLDLKRTVQTDLEQKLADVTAALRHAERRHAEARAAELVAHERAALEQLTEQEHQFQVQIALEREKRRSVEEMLSKAARDLEEAERRNASALTQAAAQTRELERAGQREAELVAQSQSERAMRAALEHAIADGDANMRETQQRHDAALAKAAEELVEQRARFDRELSHATGEGDQLRERLTKVELSLNESRHLHESAATDVVRLKQREADLCAQLAQVEADRHIVEGKLSDALQEIADTRAQAQEREAYFDTRLASERLEYHNRLTDMQHECERLGLARAAADADVQRFSADLSVATRVLEDTRREFQDTVDRQSTEHATALAALAASIAERDERQERLQAALAAGRHDIEQIQETLMATVEALEASKHRQEVLQTQADCIPESHDPRHESRTSDLRVVQQSGLAVSTSDAV